ncbi:MAG: hypothetical protein QM817_19140 [Archangium sp.]
MRRELVLITLCLATSALAQARRGGTFELDPPKFITPHEGMNAVGSDVLEVEGTTHPLVDVVLYDVNDEPLTTVESGEDGRWTATVGAKQGPMVLKARARFGGVESALSVVHFTLLHDDAIEGGGCSAIGAAPWLLGAVFVLVRRRSKK